MKRNYAAKCLTIPALSGTYIEKQGVKNMIQKKTNVVKKQNSFPVSVGTGEKVRTKPKEVT